MNIFNPFDVTNDIYSFKLFCAVLSVITFLNFTGTPCAVYLCFKLTSRSVAKIYLMNYCKNPQANCANFVNSNSAWKRLRKLNCKYTVTFFRKWPSLPTLQKLGKLEAVLLNKLTYRCSILSLQPRSKSHMKLVECSLTAAVARALKVLSAGLGVPWSLGSMWTSNHKFP
jgi:hypothetical protein